MRNSITFVFGARGTRYAIIVDLFMLSLQWFAVLFGEGGAYIPAPLGCTLWGIWLGWDIARYRELRAPGRGRNAPRRHARRTTS